MKKILIFSIFAVALLSSCNDELLEPFTPGSLTQEVAITTPNDLSRLMNSTYQIMTTREDIVFTSVFTDEAGIGFANGGQGINDDYVFFLNVASAAPNNIWNNNNLTLSRANRVIVFADDLIAKTAVPAQITILRRLKAEALTIRAFCHLRLLSYFSTDTKSDAALAAVLIDRIFTTADAVQQRNTNAQFYTSIHKDLNDALAIFAGAVSPYTGANAKIYAGTNLVKALKARAFALKGDYTNAEIWANDVINTSGLVLADVSNYQNVFFTDNEAANVEVIFKLKRTPVQNAQGTNLHNGYASIQPNVTGSPFYEVSRGLFNVLNTADIRFRTIVAPSSVIDPNYATSADVRNSDKLIINKHGGAATGTATAAATAANSFNNDIKLVRLTEMFFIRAEARVAAGDLNGAAAVVKTILDKRFATAQPLPSYGTPEAAWKDILDQRRIEFAFEGYRFIDLKRIGILANAVIDRHPADYAASSANYPAGNPSNLPLTSNKFALPIPQVELNANPSIQQNPGY